MDRLLKYTFLLFLLAFTAKLSSQNSEYTFGNVLEGDTLLSRVVIMDSAYLNRDIIQLITTPDYFNSQIEVDARLHIRRKLNNYIATASSRLISGYRIRIFFSNNQQARVKSEELVETFSRAHPGIGVYRTYDNPYFKVTVGDLRTKSHAVKLLNRLEKEYSSAFIVRENINFPPL